MNKYRFPIWFRIYPDEHLMTWLDAIASANGMPREDFITQYIGENRLERYRSSTLLELENICAKYEKGKFPTVEEIMSKHTEFGTMIPFRSRSMNILTASQIIRSKKDIRMFPAYQKHNLSTPMCCPKCMEEDRKNGRRPYIRIWHSFMNVSACARHGCTLQQYNKYDSTLPVIEADNENVRYARFLYQIYLHQPKVTYNNIKDLLPEEKTRQISGYYPTLKASPGKLIKAFCDEYEIDEFLELVKGRQREEYQIISNTCPDCGRVYHSFGAAKEYGYGCPACEGEYDDLELLQKRLDLSWNSEYEVVGFPDKDHFRVRHRPCGKEYVLSFSTHMLAHERYLCDECDYKYRDRIGETAVMSCGEICTIIAYRSSEDIDVRFEDDGVIVENASYGNFKKGSIAKPQYSKKNRAEFRVGERRCMNCGIWAEIIAYRSNLDMDVCFEDDGTIVEKVGYGNFVKGKIAKTQNAKKNKASLRIGERRCMNCGIWAEIIAYRSSGDIDVSFEDDGTIVEKVRYGNFKAGRIAKPQYSKKNRVDFCVGERRCMNCGIWAEIIAYRSNLDIDVRFDDDGSIAKKVSYGNFTNGKIAKPQNSTRNAAERHTGEKRLMNCGIWAEIIDYRSSNDIDIRFEDDGTIAEKVRYGNFKAGRIAKP